MQELDKMVRESKIKRGKEMGQKIVKKRFDKLEGGRELKKVSSG